MDFSKGLFKILGVLLVFASLFSCGGSGRSGVVAETEAIASAVETPAYEQSISLSDSLLIHKGADTIRMGRVKHGGVLTKKVELVNLGEKPFVILGVDKTCGCVDLKYPKHPMKIGQRYIMDVEFDSKTESGGVSLKTVSIKTSLGSKPYILVVIAEIE